MNNDKHTNDPVEEELRKLQPRELSAGFVERLAQRLSDQQPSVADDGYNDTHKPLRIWPAVATLAAAVVVVLTVWLAGPSDDPALTDRRPGTHVGSDMALSESDEIAPLEMDRSLPTLGNYRSLIGDSPEALEALLQEHADNLLAPTRNLSLTELIEETSS